MTENINFYIGLLLLISTHNAFAQGTGIGTNDPDPSAALEIKDAQRGILIPRVSLQTTSDKTTIPAPATGLLLYNTTLGLNAGEGYYSNTGTPASPSWRNISELHLPYTSAAAEDLMVSLTNSKGADATTLHLSNVQGYALSTQGKIKLAGNNQAPGLGKELTSDAQGNATWEGAVAFRASGVVGGGSEKIKGGLALEAKIPFANEEYDLAGNYSGPNGTPHSVLTAPVKGIYSFNVGVNWSPDADMIANVFVTIRKSSAGTVTEIARIAVDPYENYLKLSTDVLLEVNDQIYVTILHTHAQKYITLSNSSFFTGKLMIRQ